MIDVVVHDCASAAHLSQPDHLEFPARGLEEAEERKNKKYKADIKDGFEFEPFAMGTQGELGPNARAWVGRLATAIAKRQCGGNEPPDGAAARIAISLRARLGITLMRAQADQVLDVGTGRVAARPRGADGGTGRGSWGARWTHSVAPPHAAPGLAGVHLPRAAAAGRRCPAAW